MKLAVVLVHYHAGELTRRALQHIAADAERSSLELETVIIDHGGTPDDRAVLAALRAVRVVDPGSNRGYSGGVNRGVHETAADWILFLNPDVRLQSGALVQLLAALQRGYGVAGPRFYWDAERRFLLPPAEERGRWPAVLEALAATSQHWAGVARRRWRRQARRHWRATEVLDSHDLSGGCLLVSRAAWRRVGAFDEAYRLYFEETDWLLRARRLGIRSAHVPTALAIHDVGRSAAREARAQRWFEESAALFRRRQYGEGFARFVERLGGRSGRPKPEPAPGEALTLGDESSVPGLPVWVEISPNASGYPAASERIAEPGAGGWSPPPRVREALLEGQWTLRLVSDRGREGGPRRPPP